jgi:hypothetical protein
MTSRFLSLYLSLFLSGAVSFVFNTTSTLFPFPVSSPESFQTGLTLYVIISFIRMDD